jgi:protease-4
MVPNSTPEPRGEEPVAAELVRRGPPKPPRKKRSWFAALLLVMLLLGLGGSMLLNIVLVAGGGVGMFASDPRVREKFHSYERFGSDKVVIISVKGAIMDAEGFVKRQIDRAAKDDRVKAVVLRVDSPGGTVTASDYIHHHLRQLAEEKEIPIVVSMGGIAASGGYYVAMAVGDAPDTIFAEPTTWTGSIGVLIPLYNLADLMEKWGIEEDTIASHRLKTMGSFAKPMTEEERKIWQALVAESFDRFKDIIRQGRPEFAKDPDALDRLATGQIYTADQAQANGLVDKIGFVEDAIDRAIQLAGLSKDDVCVVEYKPELTLADVLTGSGAQSRTLGLAALLDWTSPRAYYLSTSLPAAVSSSR